MPQTTLHFIKSGTPDDIIVLRPSLNSPGMYLGSMRPGQDSADKYNFLVSRDGLRAYVSDMLKMLTLDADPVDFLQITHATSPSVLIPVIDLDNAPTRWFIEDNIVSSVCDQSVRRISLE
jgi:hypothetical protein